LTAALILSLAAGGFLAWYAVVVGRNANHVMAEVDRLDAVLFELAQQVDSAARVAADARNTAVATAEFVDAALGIAGSDGADLMTPTPRPDASAN
jgi:hypothetical protein